MATTPSIADRERAVRPRSRLAGRLWFGAMVVGWLAFYALMLVAEPTLHELFADVRGLPLVLEGLVWLAFFPFVLALAFWTGGWVEGLRFALVASCAVAWTLMFYPVAKGEVTEGAPRRASAFSRSANRQTS